jgi:hypothetical protein
MEMVPGQMSILAPSFVDLTSLGKAIYLNASFEDLTPWI